ncbi:hypothetical protein QZH41_013826 [Actinostola sp. cb2023]|nr:hypothetical protein QZH41_013826 [Actinostola sp. cb2023]
MEENVEMADEGMEVNVVKAVEKGMKVRDVDEDMEENVEMADEGMEVNVVKAVEKGMKVRDVDEGMEENVEMAVEDGDDAVSVSEAKSSTQEDSDDSEEEEWNPSPEDSSDSDESEVSTPKEGSSMDNDLCSPWRSSNDLWRIFFRPHLDGYQAHETAQDDAERKAIASKQEKWRTTLQKHAIARGNYVRVSDSKTVITIDEMRRILTSPYAKESQEKLHRLADAFDEDDESRCPKEDVVPLRNYVCLELAVCNGARPSLFQALTIRDIRGAKQKAVELRGLAKMM